MPTFEEAKRKVAELVVAKGFGNTAREIPNKLLFAFIELGEAGDSWKKGKPNGETIEELIDVIFYVLDASRLIDPAANLDEVFERKLMKNLTRPQRYGEAFREKLGSWSPRRRSPRRPRAPSSRPARIRG